MKKLLAASLLLLMAVLSALTACNLSTVSSTTPTASSTIGVSSQSSASSSTVSQKTLVIGGDASLTGTAGADDVALQEGWQTAVNKYNEAGGLKIGNDTYNIKLVVLDDAMSADQAVSNVTELIEQYHAAIIIGPPDPALKAAVYPVTARNGVLMADTDGLNTSLLYPGSPEVGPGKPLYISMASTVDEISPFLLDYLVQTYSNVKTVAICGVQEDDLNYLVTDKGGIDDQLAARGISQAGDVEQFAPDTTDFGPVAKDMLANNPDAIFMPVSTPTSFGLAVKAARGLGFNGPMFFGTDLDIDVQAKLSGVINVTDIFGGGPTLADQAGLPQAVKDVQTLYLQNYPAKDLISAVIAGYNGLDVLLQTIEKARSVDPATIVKTYEGLTNPGDLQTTYGPAYTGGLQTFGVNRVLCSPYILARTAVGISYNFKTVDINIP